MAVVAGCIPALQPILLGGLLAAHRLDAAQIGQAATVEALAMAVSVTVATAFLRLCRHRERPADIGARPVQRFRPTERAAG